MEAQNQIGYTDQPLVNYAYYVTISFSAVWRLLLVLINFVCVYIFQSVHQSLSQSDMLNMNYYWAPEAPGNNSCASRPLVDYASYVNIHYSAELKASK